MTKNNWGFELNNISAAWKTSKKNKDTLNNINFKLEIKDGITTVLPIMGPSGQGKSTLLYLLAALKWPKGGSIVWHLPDGKMIEWHAEGKHLSEESLVQLHRKYFGFAFQASSLSNHLTLIENIAYPLLLQGQSWKNALEKAESRFDDVFFLPDEKEDKKFLMNSYPSRISGGQRQRAALLQAVIHDPCVLFADEPTGQLDLHTRRQVMEVLRNWVKNGNGKHCLVWVTHHHTGDLKLMETNDLLFVDNQQCDFRNRQWLENWMEKALE
ncbi:ABC transporter ATP-binding protein [Candidatus Venteria ishoeyi]|uniref:ABC transporter ATP-binding protein n=1 Tax=Candidatus Venteria ishoeyi TaxID=1899563 RepID=UPI0025A57CD5|nr:ABC transporter ATP-binding protein [Candidatus Venteria ishoeyi]MDM8547872.1 ABC transporter ATP-binding protein [Candidatus Venteria ishoeyi]